MLKLFCIALGEEHPIPVDIAEAETVGDLKDKIKGKQMYQFPADEMQLYRVNGLMQDEAGRLMLNGTTIDMRSCVWETFGGVKAKMPAVSLISECFQDVDVRVRRMIHVLVVAPVAVPTMLPAVASCVHCTPKKFIHSNMGQTNGQEMLTALDIQVVPMVPFAGNNVQVPVSPFQWESTADESGAPLTEEQQRRRPDLLIMRPHAVSDAKYLPGVKLVVEVKRQVADDADYEALSELVALDVLANGYVMALLTDLNDDWRFFWVADTRDDGPAPIQRTIIKKVCITKPEVAFQVIQALLVLPECRSELDLPCFERPIKMRKLNPMAAPGSGDGSDEMIGIRESIERYYDIQSELGPDEDMARALAQQVVRSIPAFSLYPESMD
ncbi:hypothetical protein H257_09838 [Aphanomyces astaci]|uniref:Crinkler effector protein N-terminal domain-containing protein n=1 Tax=Aphanomyces astaci TaxID=112090 RepID=W4GA78_APHAT|nr:hypothetical protein H257_09838 [Aphanomyces astaci]ETV75863.1 hypothetical protein H257_09838 [Aphanomyces astaci]|eukprot:XP_009834505.1 hypothetical protein H257_09838 [Aphanomyces astaci]